ncbi:MAG: hypothetical protein GW859_09510 [Sphingomonadales bacterium]|nr:hypothetical protein [Sphingomonadales bacterium]
MAAIGLIVGNGGHQPVVHFLYPAKAERWRRLAERNRGPSDTFRFEVGRATSELCESLFEPPGDDELVDAAIV